VATTGGCQNAAHLYRVFHSNYNSLLQEWACVPLQQILVIWKCKEY
jgi:hypothetical protein